MVAPDDVTRGHPSIAVCQRASVGWVHLPTDASPSDPPSRHVSCLPAFPGWVAHACVPCWVAGVAPIGRFGHTLDDAPGGDAPPATDRGRDPASANRSPARGLGTQQPAPSAVGVNHMKKAIRLRRVLIATLIVTAIMTAFPASQSMAATGSLSKIPAKVCPINWRKDTRHVKGLIRCAARQAGGRGERVVSIPFREPRFPPLAYNRWSCARGVYQHLCRYWPSRARHYGFRDWSAYNARANIFVTMR